MWYWLLHLLLLNLLDGYWCVHQLRGHLHHLLLLIDFFAVHWCRLLDRNGCWYFYCWVLRHGGLLVEERLLLVDEVDAVHAC